MGTFAQINTTTKTVPPLSNILLDFLNRESREMFGLYELLSKEHHIQFITEVLNVAVFICYEYCIENLGSVAECEIVRIAFKRREKFLDERLIRMPIREESLNDLWGKKEREYRLFKGRYDDLYSSPGKKLVEKHSHALIHRSSKIGKEIINRWEAGPYCNNVWDKIKKNVPPKEIDKIRKIPRKIKDLNLAIKGETIVSLIGSNIGVDPRYFRHVLQNHFFSIYKDEFRLRLISQLPYFRSRYGFEDEDLCYNYEAIRAVLQSIELWNLIRGMSSDVIAVIRTKPGYFLFRESFHFVASQCSSVNEVLKIFSLGSDRIKKKLTETKLLDKYNMKTIIPIKGFDLNPEEISAIDYRLKSIAGPAIDVYNELFCESSECKIKKLERAKMIHGKTLSDQDFKEKPIIAIFVALQMEREFFVRRWELESQYPPIFWTGKIQEFNLVLYGPDKAGRVPAAITTMNLFHELISRYDRKPDIFIATGIAGGFKDEGVMLGSIILAESVADLAMRKIRDEEESIKQEFRPKEYSTDERIGAFIKSSSFDNDEWERDVIRDAEWPDGLRPAIKYGPIASMDEVISSDEWVQKLRDAWPKLLGIEMESGGVCAAADSFGIKVNVIRGVSDYADPKKSDDEWRLRAMKTIAHLIERIDYNKLLS